MRPFHFYIGNSCAGNTNIHMEWAADFVAKHLLQWSGWLSLSGLMNFLLAGLMNFPFHQSSQHFEYEVTNNLCLFKSWLIPDLEEYHSDIMWQDSLTCSELLNQVIVTFCNGSHMTCVIILELLWLCVCERYCLLDPKKHTLVLFELKANMAFILQDCTWIFIKISAIICYQ